MDVAVAEVRYGRGAELACARRFGAFEAHGKVVSANDPLANSRGFAADGHFNASDFQLDPHNRVAHARLFEEWQKGEKRCPRFLGFSQCELRRCADPMAVQEETNDPAIQAADLFDLNPANQDNWDDASGANEPFLAR